MSSGMERLLMREDRYGKRDQPLTYRQQQVCNLLVQGLTNIEVGDRLGLSSRTIEEYRAIILHKMGVRNVTELVLKVHRLGKFSEETA